MAFLHLPAAFLYEVLASTVLSCLMPSCLSVAIFRLSSDISFVHHLLDLEFGLDQDTAV